MAGTIQERRSVTPEDPLELKRRQAENWRFLGEKVGKIVLEWTGKNVFNPETPDAAPIEVKEWDVNILEPSKHYDFRHIQLIRETPSGRVHVITASYASLTGLSILGRHEELNEAIWGSKVPRSSTDEEIRDAFEKAKAHPMIRYTKIT